MTLTLNEDEESLRDAVRRFVADRSPLPAVRELIAGGEPYDPAVWKQLTGQLGLAGLLIPEEYGGAGAGHFALAVALTELGAGLVPSPLLASGVLAAGLVLASGDETARRELLPGIASGELIATAALPGPAPVRGERDGGQLRLHGELSPVLNGAQAGVLLIPAGTPEGLVVGQLAGDAEGVRRTPLTAVDPTRSLARITLDGAAARPLTGDAAAALSAVADLANLALAAEQCGGMAACLAMTTSYARLRMAFGQPIGAFQGVKHRLADVATAWELGQAAMRAAARAADEDPAGFPAAAGVARLLVSGPYFAAATATIQLHGGIGYTWEHDAHLYYKNALAGKVLLGGPDEQLDRLATVLAI